MSIQHKGLADGQWQKLSLIEQLANVGSEVGRANSWKEKGNLDYSQRAFERALELIDLTILSTKSFGRLKELTRLRELLVDYHLGENDYCSTSESWEKYFHAFNFAARIAS